MDTQAAPQPADDRLPENNSLGTGRPAEARAQQRAGDAQPSGPTIGMQESSNPHADVLTEIERLRNRKSSRATSLLVLLISLGLFVVARLGPATWT